MGAIFGYTGRLTQDRQQQFLDNTHESLQFRGTIRESAANNEITLGICRHEQETGVRVICNTDASVQIAVEGEIFNGKEIAETLDRKCDHPTDVYELLPLLYEKQGENFAKNLNGGFTMAVWDKNRKKFLLIRDHKGAHSVFYTAKQDVLYFSTTVLSLIRSSGISAKIDVHSLDAYFACLALSPPRTMFENIYAVPPGQMLVVENGQYQTKDYWNLKYISEDYTVSETEFAQQVRDVFLDAVDIRARYGGRTGTLISGGIDTSAVACRLADHFTSQELNGFSIIFDHADFSDAPLQKHIYSNYNITPKQLKLSAHEWFDGFTKGIRHLDSPVNDAAFVGMYKVLELAAETGCNVIFDGETSDELFTTGHSHGERAIQKFLALPYPLRKAAATITGNRFPLGSSLISKIQRLACRIGMPDLDRRCTWIPGMYDNIREQLFIKDLIPHSHPYDTAKQYFEECRVQDPLNIYHYGLFKMFNTDDLLFKNERMASANGITLRTPFSDYRLAELAFKIPAAYKIQKPDKHNDNTKLIFKKAIKGHIPDEILYRKKTRGFSQPTNVWFRNELKENIHSMLLGSNTKIQHYLHMDFVNTVVTEHLSGKADHSYHLNAILVLESWLQEHT
jgi:asparagine synthase (glutamine-hydrolysing)